jgi:Ricin-type beta-trefoil lectin domain
MLEHRRLAFVVVPLLLWAILQGAEAAVLLGLDGKCLDVRNGENRDGADVQIYTCNGAPNQEWALNQYGEIRSLGGKCLDIRGANPTDGTPVQLYSCHGGPNQQWRSVGRGEIRGQEDKCLDVRGDTSQDGTIVQIFSCNDGRNQKWAFATLPPTNVSETMTDRCSGDVVLSRVYSEQDEVSPFNPRGTDGIFLTRAGAGFTGWSGPMPVDGHTWIRWWCHSTTGNWADPGTWRLRGGEIGIGCTGDWEFGEVESCHPTGSIDLAPSDPQGWTPERSRCESQRTRAVSARLGPNRLLEIRCLQ